MRIYIHIIAKIHDYANTPDQNPNPYHICTFDGITLKQGHYYTFDSMKQSQKFFGLEKTSGPNPLTQVPV